MDVVGLGCTSSLVTAWMKMPLGPCLLYAAAPCDQSYPMAVCVCVCGVGRGGGVSARRRGQMESGKVG